MTSQRALSHDLKNNAIQTERLGKSNTASSGLSFWKSQIETGMKHSDRYARMNANTTATKRKQRNVKPRKTKLTETPIACLHKHFWEPVLSFSA